MTAITQIRLCGRAVWSESLLITYIARYIFSSQIVNVTTHTKRGSYAFMINRLPYLPLVFWHLNFLPHLFWNLYRYNSLPVVMPTNNAGRVENRVDPDETLRSVAFFYTVSFKVTDFFFNLIIAISLWNNIPKRKKFIQRNDRLLRTVWIFSHFCVVCKMIRW